MCVCARRELMRGPFFSHLCVPALWLWWLSPIQKSERKKCQRPSQNLTLLSVPQSPNFSFPFFFFFFSFLKGFSLIDSFVSVTDTLNHCRKRPLISNAAAAATSRSFTTFWRRESDIFALGQRRRRVDCRVVKVVVEEVEEVVGVGGGEGKNLFLTTSHDLRLKEEKVCDNDRCCCCCCCRALIT